MDSSDLLPGELLLSWQLGPQKLQSNLDKLLVAVPEENLLSVGIDLLVELNQSFPLTALAGRSTVRISASELVSRGSHSQDDLKQITVLDRAVLWAGYLAEMQEQFQGLFFTGKFSGSECQLDSLLIITFCVSGYTKVLSED